MDVTEDLVRDLLRAQHPDLADLALREAGSGWDNRLFRLGTDLAVRIPHRPLGAPLIEHEQRWLPTLAPGLPLPIPDPVRVGVPGCGFPWRWSIVRWFPGDTVLHTPPADPMAAAQVLGEFIGSLHRPAPADAPENPWRGIALAGRAPRVEEDLVAVRGLVDTERIAAVWRWHADLPRWNQPQVWLHGDLHPGNVLVHDGAISAVIDFGDLTSGDPATDLAVAWMVFPDPAVRERFRVATGHDDDTWRRARGWALCLGLVYLADTNPQNTYQPLGRATIEAALADVDADPSVGPAAGQA